MAKEKKKKIDPNLFSTNKRYRREDIAAAKKWFRDQIKELRSRKGKLPYNMSDLRFRGTPEGMIGRMHFYKYDPKHKETLPYYDIFPLIIGVDLYKDGWLGLNLHYLPIYERTLLLQHLFGILNNTRFDKSTKFQISYNLLKNVSKYKYYRPCLKRYLADHVRSNVMRIRSTQWAKAIVLPVAKFKKESISTVWKDSRRIWKG